MTPSAAPRTALSFAVVVACVASAAAVFFIALPLDPLPGAGALAAVGVTTIVAALLAALSAAGKVPGVAVAALGLPWLAGVVTSWRAWQESFAALGVIGLAEKLTFLQQSTAEGLGERALGGGLAAAVGFGCAVAFALSRGAPAARLVGAGVALLFAGLALRASMLAWGLGSQLSALSAVNSALDDTAEGFVPLTETYALAGWGVAALGVVLAVGGAVRGKQPALWAWVVVGVLGVLVPQAVDVLTWRSQAALAAQVPRFDLEAEGFTPVALQTWQGPAKDIAGVVAHELVVANDGPLPRGGLRVELVLAQSASPAALHDVVGKLEGNAQELALVGRVKEGFDPVVSPRLATFLNPQAWVRSSVAVCSPSAPPSAYPVEVIAFDGSPAAGVSRMLEAIDSNACVSAATRPATP